jgi:myo-inositol-1(or 4)-monophosphatase
VADKEIGQRPHWGANRGNDMGAVDFEAFVHELADVSGQAILPFFRTALGVEDKSRGAAFDPVTAADRAAEQAMRALIRRNFPGHGVVGEEYDNEHTDAEFVWMLDPIDGTKSFIAGMPAWGTLIGLTRNGRPVYGMMHQPFIRERFYGDGDGARYRGPAGERRLSVRACEKLADALMVTTSPRLMDEADRARFSVVEEHVRMSRYGGDCYAYCMVAAGHVDLVIETNLQDHDIVPLIPIIEGAGGIVTDWAGDPAVAGGRVVVSGDRRLHDAALEMLAKG